VLDKSLLPDDPELPGEIRYLEMLKDGISHRVYRVEVQGERKVLKHFKEEGSLEIKVYSLLAGLGIPVLPVYWQTSRSLVIEDLASSLNWRLAEEGDMHTAQTGAALAFWYKMLHSAGRDLAEKGRFPHYISSWSDVITPQALEDVGLKFGFSETPVWRRVVPAVGDLASAYRSQPQTFNYSDFDRENLALSHDNSPRKAIVFDYDCFQKGTAFSDWRNVTYGLKEDALHEFSRAYGPVCEVERVLDAPLSILEGLVIASRRERFPGWAAPLLEQVRNGELERCVKKALSQIS
jgi:hypothetical protein